MIAATSRAAAGERPTASRARARAHRDRIVELTLGPLRRRGRTAALAARARRTRARGAREVIALAEGNPLYLEQLLRSLLESGGLAARRTWALTVPAAQLPTGLESLLVARIAALPRDARRIAQVGAVLGRTFAPTLLQSPGARGCRAEPRAAPRANIIRETRAIPNREYAFTHGLLHEAALSTLARARRRELYRLVAAAHEQAFVDSLDDHSSASPSTGRAVASSSARSTTSSGPRTVRRRSSAHSGCRPLVARGDRCREDQRSAGSRSHRAAARGAERIERGAGFPNEAGPRRPVRNGQYGPRACAFSSLAAKCCTQVGLRRGSPRPCACSCSRLTARSWCMTMQVVSDR